ncbi:hypothetical protein J6590_094875 [Homalodisca vitripennis]|nr:hypothetical protein J6590_094875 [Homalodisca vitripennis]
MSAHCFSESFIPLLCRRLIFLVRRCFGTVKVDYFLRRFSESFIPLLCRRLIFLVRRCFGTVKVDYFLRRFSESFIPLLCRRLIFLVRRCFGTVKVDYFLRRLNGFSTRTSQLRQCLPLYRRTPPSGLLFCRTDVIISIHQFVSTDSYAMKTGDVFQDNASAATVHGYLEPVFAYCAEMAKRIGHDAHGGLPTVSHRGDKKAKASTAPSKGTTELRKRLIASTGLRPALGRQNVQRREPPAVPSPPLANRFLHFTCRTGRNVQLTRCPRCWKKTKVKCGLLGVHDVSPYFSICVVDHVSWTARTGVSCLETEINCSANSSHASGSVNVFRNSVSFNGLRLYSDLDPKTCKFALTYRQLLDDLVLAANGSIRLNVQGSDLKRNAIRLLEQSQHVYAHPLTIGRENDAGVNTSSPLFELPWTGSSPIWETSPHLYVSHRVCDQWTCLVSNSNRYLLLHSDGTVASKGQGRPSHVELFSTTSGTDIAELLRLNYRCTFVTTLDETVVSLWCRTDL